MNSPSHTNDCSAILKRRIDVLQRVDGFMSTLSDLKQLLEQVLRESLYVTDAEACSLALYDEAADELFFEIVLGEKGPETKRTKIKRGEGIVWDVALKEKSRNIKDVYNEKEFDQRVDQETGFKTRTMLAVPMKRRDRLIGVIEVLNKKNGGLFSEEDQAILELLAHQAAIAVENARLYQMNMEKERLASLGQGISGAAHCIKNILNMVTMGASGVEAGIEKGNMDLLKHSWQSIQKGCDRISEMVLDMLDYSKERSPECVPVALNQLLAEITAMVKPKLEEHNVKLVQDFDPDIGILLLDEKGIHRCIINLISNALDALDESNGCVVVRSRLDRETKEVEVQISDNGRGIANMGKIFDVFYSTKGSKGTGLGLSVTKKIIDEHGGTLSAKSKEGEGTTFVIRLPARPANGC